MSLENAKPVELERHYSPREISEMWGLSIDTIRRNFAHAAGVLKIGHAETSDRNKYLALRIPESTGDESG